MNKAQCICEICKREIYDSDLVTIMFPDELFVLKGRPMIDLSNIENVLNTYMHQSCWEKAKNE